MGDRLGWLIFGCILAGVSGLKLNSHHFPSHVILGKTMNLTCDYDTQGDKIYQVKWYKDEQEFYTYNPGGPAKEFGLSGVDINIDMEQSGAKSVIIHNVDLLMEGKYGCEVTVEGTFDTVIATGDVKVVELPQNGPVISGEFLHTMDEGDWVRVNCTSCGSRPAPTLTWYINGARSDNASLMRYPEIVQPSGLREVTLGLDFRLRGSHFSPPGHVTLKCSAEIESVFYSSVDVRIVSRTMASQSRLASGCSRTPVSFLQLLLLSLRCLLGG